MLRKDFNFDLPEELIAQTPIDRRDNSRLMAVDKASGRILHRHFYDIIDFLNPGDCLVLNDSRVLPARLLGIRVPTGGAVEVVLLRDIGGGIWECLTRPGRKTKPGTVLSFGNGNLTATVVDAGAGGNKLLKFEYEGVFLEVLERLGKMPLPPYIHEELNDSERYQTVYSRVVGSAAAPTAGLHFTNELLDNIRQKGIDTAFVTLHVGLGTFRPVKSENVEDHEMHSEFFTVTKETAELVNKAKQTGHRVIAVGTTSCRTLESIADESGHISECSGWTNIFIYPGYSFKCIDGLITNFHLPESTLIMLVSAFAGRENVFNAYNEAIKEKYRFFSFGDAMYIGETGQK